MGGAKGTGCACTSGEKETAERFGRVVKELPQVLKGDELPILHDHLLLRRNIQNDELEGTATPDRKAGGMGVPIEGNCNLAQPCLARKDQPGLNVERPPLLLPIREPRVNSTDQEFRVHGHLIGTLQAVWTMFVARGISVMPSFGPKMLFGP